MRAQAPKPNLDLGRHLKNSLRKIPLARLARSTDWMERTAQKISPMNLVTAAMLLVSQPEISLSVLAVLVGLLSRKTLSKQAVHERLDAPVIAFLKEVVAGALGLGVSVPKALARWSWPFARILVQDSTTVKLNARLAALFPGGANQHGATPGVLRVQAIFDLLSQRWVNFALSPYVRNDQKASPDLLPHVRPNDLVLRDLGYFAIPVLQQIVHLGAWFLSRFYFRTAIFDLQGNPLNLLQLLRQQGRVDRWVLLGAKEKMRVRLVAVPVPPAVANERRRKAKAHLQNRCQLSKEYLAMQGWTIFVTTVPAEVLPARQVLALYGQRWQIEIIFKGWKSHFNLEAVSSTTTAELLQVAIYGKLLFITLTHPLRAPSLEATEPGEEMRCSSRLKVDRLTSQCLLSVVLEHWGINVAEGLSRQIDYHGRYEKRKRQNIWQKLFAFA